MSDWEFPIDDVRAREAAVERIIQSLSLDELSRFTKEIAGAAASVDPGREARRVLTAWYRTALLRSDTHFRESVEWARSKGETHPDEHETVEQLQDRLGLPRPA